MDMLTWPSRTRTGSHTPLFAVVPFTLLAQVALSQAPTVTRDFTIGCADCSGALQFASLQTLEISPKGEILVVDRDNPMVRLFDATGKPVWSGGRKGRGPGEYQYILRGAFRSDGGLDLVDFTGMRLTTLGPDHNVVGTQVLQAIADQAGAADAIRSIGPLRQKISDASLIATSLSASAAS